MSDISASLAAQVVERAGNRCEYCGLSQFGQEATFHVDHVIPRASGGQTRPDNLALACVSCSLRKGAKLTGMDSLTNLDCPIFNPRTDSWVAHFRWDGVRVEGLTPTGRATVAALAMNRPLILAIRAEEFEHGRFPPPVS